MDADETIFDFGKCEYEALREALEYHGLGFSNEICESFSSINAKLWKEFEKSHITRSELRVQRFRELIAKCFEGFDNTEILADTYVDRLSEQAVLIDGAADALEKLSQSFDIYIITNGLKKVQRGRFAKTDITEFIKKLYISDEIGMNKPDKKFFDYVLDDIPEKDRSKILVVGDSLSSDMQGGRNAGLDTCVYDPKNKISMPNKLCDYHITELVQILDIAEE